MNGSVNPRVLKEIWQEYLKAFHEKKKEEKLQEFLLSLLEFKAHGDVSSIIECELTSIGNLLGCELLKVINYQCEILEHDTALVCYFQKGSGLCLLQALHILADQVNNYNSEVSNVLVSILPCLLSVSCEFEDEAAFALLKKLSISYKDITNAKNNFRSLYETLLPSPSSTKEIDLLQLFALLLDIISKLCTKGFSLAIAESSFNVSDKLTTLLLEFSKNNQLKDNNDSGNGEDFPECTWTQTVKSVSTCMVLFPLWTTSATRGKTDACSHRIDQSELVKKLLEVVKNLKNNINDDVGFKDGNFDGEDILGYQLFLMCSLLGLVFTLLKDTACSEVVSHSGPDLSRKVYSKEQVETFIRSSGPELVTFMPRLLNKVFNNHWKVNTDCQSLLRDEACFVVATAGQLVSAMKKVLFSSSCKSDEPKLEFTLNKYCDKDSGRSRRGSRSSRMRSKSSSQHSHAVTSSSDSDGEPSCQVIISQQKDHPSKDCVVSCLCSTILSVFEASAVEAIDVVSLNCLSRCGACSCMDVSSVAMALLSRFMERPSNVQDLLLGLLCKIILKDVATSNSSVNPPDPNNTDEVFRAEPSPPACPSTEERWSFLEHLFLLATEHDGELTIKILKHLKALAKLGSPCLREALFDKVVLPFLLKHKDIKRVNALSEVCGKLALRPDSTKPDFDTPTECDVSKSSEPTTSPGPKTIVSDDALRISLTSLLTLLETEALRRLFLNSDGVKSVVNFLGHESLHSICLGILQLLASQEDSKTVPPEVDDLTNESHEMSSENGATMAVNILWRSMVLLDPTPSEAQLKYHTSEEPLSDFAAKIRFSLRTQKVLRLLCQLWRTCLELLKRNDIFRELFVRSSGPACVVVVLEVVQEYLKEVSARYDGIKDHVVGCVTFMEHAVAVGLEFEKELVDGVQLSIHITEAVRVIQRLVHEDKTLKDIAGKTFCTSLLNLAVGAIAEDTNSSLKADISDSEKLLFNLENSDDSASDSDCFVSKSPKTVGSSLPRHKDLEPGYEADVEVSSDVGSGKESGIGRVRLKAKVILPRRRTEVADGIILYPQMCEQLLHFLEHDQELTGNDKLLLLFGLEGIVSLASYSNRNRDILCQQGILYLVIKTFTPCLVSVDQCLKGVQKTVLDLIVVLAEYEFNSEELKMYLKLLETNNPVLAPLIKALRNISSTTICSHSPTYVHVFPTERSSTSLRTSNHKSPNSASQNETKTPEDTKAIELKLNQSLPWPVGSFSLSFWLYLDSGLTDREHHARKQPSHGGHATRFADRGDHARKVGSEHFVHVISFGTKTLLFEIRVNFLKTTLVCRWSACNTEDVSVSGVRPPCEAFVKFPLKDHIWYHLVLGVRAGREDDVTAGKVTLIVDGSFETTKALTYPSIPLKKNQPVSVWIGDAGNVVNERPKNAVGKPKPSYKLGNVVAFIGDLHRDGSPLTGLISMLNSKSQEKLPTIDKHGALYLKLMGANCQAVDLHLTKITSEDYSNQLDLEILGSLPEDSSQSFLCGPHGEPILVAEQQLNAMKVFLKKQLLLVYSPVTPSEFLEYKLEGANWGGNTPHGDNVITGSVVQKAPSSVRRRKRLEEAVHSVGGVGVFLFLFAKTVEKTKDERAQADALSIIFTMSKENISFAKELEGLMANKMILKVLLTPNCMPGYHFAKVFFSSACDGEVFRETGLHDKPCVVNHHTTAIVKNYEILREFLLNWRIWYREGISSPWKTVLLVLEALTSDTHPYSVFNIKQFERADALGILLLGCQEMQAEDHTFSSETSRLHLNIIQNLLGCPADPRVLKRICEFLIAVHPTYETLVIHGPGNLYFSPIAKLQGRKTRSVMEVDSKVSPWLNRANDIDENGERAHISASQNEKTERSLGTRATIRRQESEDRITARSLGTQSTLGRQESEDGTSMMDMITNDLPHGEIARTNVLNITDSKDMIISVEHLRGPDLENPVIEFPLQSPASETLPSVGSPSSPSKLTDQIDTSSQPPMVNPASCGPGTHSEPIAISPATTTNVVDSYDVVSSSEFSVSKSQSCKTATSNDDYLVVENKPGHAFSTMSTYRHYKRKSLDVREYKKLDGLRVGLLDLIYSAVVNLPDTAVYPVLGEILKFEYFLCIVNHPTERVRKLSVEILHKFLERASSNVVNLFHQMSGYHLLADQIHLHPITQEVAEACFLLFFQQPVSINQANFLESIKHGSELAKKINIQAVALLLGMLEGAISCPKVFQFLTQSFVKVLDVVENFLLKATDYGLLKTLGNTVRALCIWRLDHSSQKNERETTAEFVLDNVQYLIMAIVYRSLRMCGERYFQIFDDLLVSLDRLQFSEPGKKRLTVALAHCSRFLQQCALRFALEYFEHSQTSNKINRRGFKKTLRLSFKSTTYNNIDIGERKTSDSGTRWTTLDPASFPVPWQTGRVALPAEATPAEIANRFQEVCKKAVNFICFTDTWHKVENPLDFNLSYSQFTLPSPFEVYKIADSSFLANATETFTQWTFCFLLQLLEFCLSDGAQRCLNKWHGLVCQSKEKIRHQLCRLFIHIMSPTQECRQKYFALQLTKMKHGSELFLNLLLGAITTKQKERAVGYVRAFLREPVKDVTQEEKQVRATVQSCLKDVEVKKLEKSQDDYLAQKQQEWEKQDLNNKIQWESKNEADQKRTDQELHQLSKRITSVAIEVSKVSVDVQDKQRQNLLKHVKGALSIDVQSQKLWQTIVKQMTHERAVWHDKVFFPTSWQLDRTEGPGRMRCRLQRCHLDIDEKFIMPEHRKQQSSILPLSYLFEEHCGDASSRSVYHLFHTTDTIRFLLRCKSIMPAENVQGEILIGEKRVYFVGEEAVADLNTAQFFLDDEDITSISWLFQEIREILKRRYALKDNALEIFLTNGRTFLLAFETTEDRETVYKELIAKELPNLITATENVAELTQRWQNGELTNFAYLTELNKQACRSFNDLMQYPVFPLVLADYSCDVLDLTNRSVYRDLSKPVAVQNLSKVAKFQETYRSLSEQYDISKKLDPMNCIPPYHYGSHYSNSGTVLHFLVRLVPFTKMFLTYQDKQFDVPDRTFHAIETTWNLSAIASAPDVKELIPEFFFLPEFLLNSEGFDFGFRQNGKRVTDVLLPSWACEDPRLFTLIHRQALESDVVSSSINNWIDLVFGFKQTGQAAVEAINVFHPSTYVGGIDEDKLLEPLQRQAVQTMIETYGQTPAKLFEDPHPEKKRSSLLEWSISSGTLNEMDNSLNQSSRRSSLELQEGSSPVPTVYGIKWGNYVGSPTFPKPSLCWSDSFSSLISRLLCFPGSTRFLLPPNSTHMIVTRLKNKTTLIDWLAVLSWGHVDDILRIRDTKKGTTLCFMENVNLHKVTCCAVSEQCRSLWVGSSTGCLCVWTTRYDRNNERGLELLGRRIRLHGHHASITCVEICEAFSIVVTGSEDRTAIIWDLNRLCYIRSLPEHSTAVNIVSVSTTSGDIVTICNTATGTASELRLWSVNGRPIKKIICQDRITCVQFSRGPEGVSVNAIAAGLENGIVRLWNTWTLDHMCDIKDDECQVPIVCLAYSYTCHHLFTADSSGTVRAWGRANRANYKPRIFNGTMSF